MSSYSEMERLAESNRRDARSHYRNALRIERRATYLDPETRTARAAQYREWARNANARARKLEAAMAEVA
jgi:hypothetical protein